MYDNQKFHGLILEIAKGQFKIKCLEHTTSGHYKFESNNNAVRYKREEIIASASTPTLVGRALPFGTVVYGFESRFRHGCL